MFEGKKGYLLRLEVWSRKRSITGQQVWVSCHTRWGEFQLAGRAARSSNNIVAALAASFPELDFTSEGFNLAISRVPHEEIQVMQEPHD
jgi:hypothetical protein